MKCYTHEEITKKKTIEEKYQKGCWGHFENTHKKYHKDRTLGKKE